MSREHDRLEVLARFQTEVEAALIVEALAQRNITARAVGGFTAGFRAEAPGYVSVLVRSDDLERAKAALDAVRQEGLQEQAADEEEEGECEEESDEEEPPHAAQSEHVGDVTTGGAAGNVLLL